MKLLYQFGVILAVTFGGGTIVCSAPTAYSRKLFMDL